VKTEYKALDRQVLAVAVINKEVGDWACYIGSVPGYNHEQEKHDVALHGSKTSERMAGLLFPAIAEEYIWRP